MAADKRRAFAREYIVDHNATQAAIRAGYSPRSAKALGQRLLTFVDVQAEIEELESRHRAECIATADEIERFLTSVMRREQREHVVVTLATERSEYVMGNDDRMHPCKVRTEIPQVIEIPSKLSDANTAAKELLRRLERIETQSAQSPSNAAPGNSVTIVIPDNGR